MKKPVAKKYIVVTRSKEGSGPWLRYLRECGLQPYHFSTIALAPVDPSPELLATLRGISRFDWVVFTSANGVRFLTEFVKKNSLKRTGKKGKKKKQENSINISLAMMPKIAAIGHWTVEAVCDAGYRVAFEPSKADAKTLAGELAPVRDRSILLLRTVIASSEPVTILKKRGAKVTDMPIYSTRLISRPDRKFSQLLVSDRIGCILFASRSAVEGFYARVPKDLIDKARTLPAVAIGQSVQILLKKFGFKKVKTVENPGVEDMVAAVHAFGL